MKKFLVWLLVLATMLTGMVSCDLFSEEAEDTSDESESKENLVTDSETETAAGESDSDADGDGETEPEEEEEKSAKLVGFCTKASLYDGAFNSTVGWKAAGMGYIVKTKSGKIIAIDGGNTEDTGEFYALLKEYCDTEEVVVDYWILTHPHGDHVNALIEMVNNGTGEYGHISENLTVKNLVYYFPEGFKDKNGGTCQGYIDIMDGVSKKLGARVIKPLNGQIIQVDDVRLQFLYVPTDYAQLNNTNQLSLIFRITAEKKVLITGDAFNHSLEKMTDKYGDFLKSDILQMPHHFLCDTGDQAFYELVDASTVLLPACISGYNAMHNDPAYMNSKKHLANKWAEDNAEHVYKSFDGNFEIEI